MKISYSQYLTLKIMSPVKFKEFEKSNGFDFTWRIAFNKKSIHPMSDEFFDSYHNDIMSGKLRVPVYMPTKTFSDALTKWFSIDNPETTEIISTMPYREMLDRDVAFLFDMYDEESLLVGRVISDEIMELTYMLRTGIGFVIRFKEEPETHYVEFVDGFWDCPDKDMSMISEILRTFFLNLAFMKYAPVELDVIPGNSKTKSSIYGCKVRNEGDIDVTLLDSRWFREIIRTEGFSVRGHFRFQRFKNKAGEWDHKFIWIEGFEKHGYHRRAKMMA